MKTQDLAVKTKEDLTETLKELKIKLFKLRFDLAEKKLKDFSQIKKAKRDIARVMTILNRQS